MENNISEYQSENIERTWVLFGIFFFVIIGLGFVFSEAYGDSSFLIFSILFSVTYSFISYYYSASIALSFARAKEAKREEYPELYKIIEGLCTESHLPMPKIYTTSERQINAFATGRNADNAAVAVTAGALERLSNQELEGVLAHELSHVVNRDILVSTVAAVLAGIISMLGDIFLRSLIFSGSSSGRKRDTNQEAFFIFGIILSILAPIGTMLIQLAISRRRESLADISSVKLTENPDGLISALQKIAADQVPMLSAKDSTAHLWLDNPFKGSNTSWWRSLFMTHPPIEERIAVLRRLS